MKKVDRISGIVLVIVSIVGFIYAKATSTPSTVGLASNTYPQFLFICLAICGVVLVATSLSKDTEKAEIKTNWKALLPVVGVLLVYVLIFDHVHFIASSVIFTALEMYLFGEKRWKIIALVSIIAPVTIYFLFTQAFSIMLPSSFGW